MTLPKYTNYLSFLENLARNVKIEDYYLWPRTPIAYDHQKIIARRISCSDYEVNKAHSRPTMIINQISKLIQSDQVNEQFSVLDVACGDAIVLWQIKKRFANATCYGIDCNKDRFGTHAMVQQDGVQLYNAFLQHIFTNQPPEPFDVVLMLNTYRGWEHADLREHEHELPAQADVWFQHNAKFVFLTATRKQICHLRRLFSVQILGKGEDKSKMICLSQLTNNKKSSFVNKFIGWQLKLKDLF